MLQKENPKENLKAKCPPIVGQPITTALFMPKYSQYNEQLAIPIEFFKSETRAALWTTTQKLIQICLGGIKNQIRYQPKLTFINFEFASRDGIYI
ncbi:hypothetical protein [Providencia huaxiensis]|uniref:hypothetical protein n=1 Tax=Providencia huaxiensis TaxID=2027290 RepID=UPI000C7F58C6|nr:hypothetical protein [Providencia huaxiensis]